jgi:hypothetical protein
MASYHTHQTCTITTNCRNLTTHLTKELLTSHALYEITKLSILLHQHYHRITQHSNQSNLLVKLINYPNTRNIQTLSISNC